MQKESGVAIALEGVFKSFGKAAAVRDVTIAIGEGEFFSLLGPSGCGKTTTLRMIAGFEVPDGGRIVLEGKDVTSMLPSRRPVNMVFQQYALFPHMSIYDNIAFGLKVKRVPRSEHRGACSRCWTSSSSRVSSTGVHGNYPGASSNAWRWRGLWSTGRRRCFSTSLSARST